eukprot:CAMPEP_0196651630 /NCGR_PEP_ID=MMETSP1086-20130531/665_1 /TAXON_ID=77921 /ORGANISM="Cyanoptyche  gloeocystis , Strain SAG4.97" /LENGTH=372 /DNA_ID=CAMNT_0041981731 /DNA_START=753 /DNA_END=1871 /DNA_ORIENTATION=-
MPVAEEDKTMEAVFKITEALCDFGLLRRYEPVIGVGGGVLLDMVGLAASLYRRGVPYIRVPTTLLALVDASVGAKTGVNYVSKKGELKNRIGSYHPPLAAFLDKTFLPTVDDRNMRNGICEIMKMALVRSPELFELLEKHGPAMIKAKFQNGWSADRVIELSIQLMLEELSPNLWEIELDRLVDFGHSFSKVIEMRALPELLHGEAVNLDGAVSTILAYERGLITAEERDRIFNCMIRLGLPVDHPLCVPEVLWAGLKDTLEHRDGKQRLPLPTGIGRADFVNDVTYEEICHAADSLHIYVRSLDLPSDVEVYLNGSIPLHNPDRCLLSPTGTCVGRDRSVAEVSFQGRTVVVPEGSDLLQVGSSDGNGGMR